MELNGRAILVTGGARRIGAEIVRALARGGARVIIHHNRSAGEARRLAGEIDAEGLGRPTLIRADLTRRGEIKRMVGEIRHRVGRLDGIVNNASVFRRAPFDRISETEWDANFAIHLTAPFLLAQLLRPLMCRAAQDEGQAKIVNIADWVGTLPYKDFLAYSVSKGSLITLTRALAKELAPAIQVNCVCPGPVLFPEKMRRRDLPIIAGVGAGVGAGMAAGGGAGASAGGRMGCPQDVVDAVLYFLKSSSYVTGAILTVDGGRSLG